jgi:hypothetical protein
MNGKKNLKVQKKSNFVTFLDSINSINSSAIFTLKAGEGVEISTLACNSDNTTIIYGRSIVDESSYEGNLNIPDIKKLVLAINNIDTEDVELQINTNNLEYKGKSLKFKYHLYEEGFMVKPKINISKINNFDFDVKFTLTNDQIRQIYKGNAFTRDTNKLYFYTEDDQLKVELTDKAKHNTNSFGITLCESTFNLSPLAINYDNFKLVELIGNGVDISINIQYGIVTFDVVRDTTSLKYIINALIQ